MMNARRYEATSWFVFFVPAKTPPEIIAKLNGSIRKAIDDPGVQKRFADLGAEARSYTSLHNE